MAVRCVGFKNGKYLIEESLPGVRLQFTGADADKFAQVRIPKRPKQTLEFSLTVEFMRSKGFLPLDEIEAAKNDLCKFVDGLTMHVIRHIVKEDMNIGEENLAMKLAHALDASIPVFEESESKLTSKQVVFALYIMFGTKLANFINEETTPIQGCVRCNPDSETSGQLRAAHAPRLTR